MKYSTEIERSFKKKFIGLSLTAYRVSRMVPARMSREKLRKLGELVLEILTVKVVISFY